MEASGLVRWLVRSDTRSGRKGRVKRGAVGVSVAVPDALGRQLLPGMPFCVVCHLMCLPNGRIPYDGG